jgi:hypothetical protein
MVEGRARQRAPTAADHEVEFSLNLFPDQVSINVPAPTRGREFIAPLAEILGAPQERSRSAWARSPGDDWRKMAGCDDNALEKWALIGVLHLKDPFGHHERIFVIGLPQVRNGYPIPVVGGMDHLALTQIDAGMAH